MNSLTQYLAPSSHHRGTPPGCQRPARRRTQWSHCWQRCRCSPPRPDLERGKCLSNSVFIVCLIVFLQPITHCTILLTPQPYCLDTSAWSGLVLCWKVFLCRDVLPLLKTRFHVATPSVAVVRITLGFRLVEAHLNRETDLNTTPALFSPHFKHVAFWNSNSFSTSSQQPLLERSCDMFGEHLRAELFQILSDAELLLYYRLGPMFPNTFQFQFYYWWIYFCLSIFCFVNYSIQVYQMLRHTVCCYCY